MEVKDFNIFNLSLQQKRLLKKKIGNAQGARNDTPEFRVSNNYTANSIDLELVAGVSKFDEGAFVGDFKYKYSNEKLIIATIYDDGYVSIQFVSFMQDGTITVENFIWYNADVSYLENMNVGDVFSLNINDCYTKHFSGIGSVLSINSNKTINSSTFKHQSYFTNNLITFKWRSGTIDIFGHIKKLDTINKLLYISINDEVWKYSFVIDDDYNYRNFTFVEVVQS